MPTGDVIEKAFYPRLTELGQRHPVTRGLEGSASEPPHWGRWFRTDRRRAAARAKSS